MDESKKIILELTLDELKLIDKHIEYNDETKSVFDKIKYAYPQPKMTFQKEGDYVVVSYNDSTYYRLMNETTFSWYIKMSASVSHPVPTLVMINDAETERLLDGLYYNHIVVKKEKEMIRQNLKNSLKELANGDVRPIDDVIEEAKAQQTEKWKELQRKIDAPAEGIYDNIDIDKLLKKWEENPPEFLKFELGKTLTDIIYRWWDDVFTTHSDWDMETSIEDLVDQIQLWLPKEQSAAGSQSIGVEELVQGFNDCLNKIKNKLR